MLVISLKALLGFSSISLGSIPLAESATDVLSSCPFAGEPLAKTGASAASYLLKALLSF